MANGDRSLFNGCLQVFYPIGEANAKCLFKLGAWTGFPIFIHNLDIMVVNGLNANIS